MTTKWAHIYVQEESELKKKNSFNILKMAENS